MIRVLSITTIAMLASLAAGPAMAQVAPGVGVGAGGASAGLDGASQTGPTNITGAGAGIQTLNPQIGSPGLPGNPSAMAVPGGVTPATPGIVNTPGMMPGASGTPGVPYTPPHSGRPNGATPR